LRNWRQINADERWRDVRSKCHTRHLACEIRDPQGKNRGHENVKERCTVSLLVYYIFYGIGEGKVYSFWIDLLFTVCASIFVTIARPFPTNIQICFKIIRRRFCPFNQATRTSNFCGRNSKRTFSETIWYNFVRKVASLPNGCHGNKGPPKPLPDSREEIRWKVLWVSTTVLVK
jgi:hypothetical protein